MSRHGRFDDREGGGNDDRDRGHGGYEDRRSDDRGGGSRDYYRRDDRDRGRDYDRRDDRDRGRDYDRRDDLDRDRRRDRDRDRDCDRWDRDYNDDDRYIRRGRDFDRDGGAPRQMSGGMGVSSSGNYGGGRSGNGREHDVSTDTLDDEAVRRKNVLESWSTVLAKNDASWDVLQAEKRAGWESEAVDWRWRQRDATFGHGGSSKVDRVNNRGMVPSTRKYVVFYREWMPKLAPELFGHAADESRPRVFADVGSAPGGMCEYLVGDLGWSGFAFSLAPGDEGFGMQFASPRLAYADSDVSVAGEWRRLLDLVGGRAVCDFVNGGVVIDRGQQRVEPSEASDTLAMEHHLEIYRNELLLGLHALRPGGALYFAYQLGQTALLMRLLLALRPAFASVRVTPTFAVGRTPMYVWLGGYAGLETAAAAAAVRFLSETPVADAAVEEVGEKTGGGGGGCAWDAWHQSEWSAEVASLHTELRESLAHVWTTQADHLRKQRLEAENAFESSQQTRSGAGKGYCSGKGFGHHRGSGGGGEGKGGGGIVGGGIDSGGKGGGGKGGSGKGGGKGGQGGRGRSCVCVLDVLPPGTSLLGDACSFCDAFFHVRDTREAGLPLCCLRQHAECEGRNTVIVARLTDREGRVLFVARFMNRDKQTHAERVMIEDSHLREAVERFAAENGGGGGGGSGVCGGSRGSGGSGTPGNIGTLHAFISLQPCHHSSGNERLSCTRDLLAFHSRVLSPLGVAFELVIAYPYRSHWQPDLMARDELIELGARTLFGGRFHSSALGGQQSSVTAAVEALGPLAAEQALNTALTLLENAKEGARLLVRGAPEGFSTRSFTEADWRWIVSLCDKGVQDAYLGDLAAAGTLFTPERRETRAAADRWTQALLDGFRGAADSAGGRPDGDDRQLLYTSADDPAPEQLPAEEQLEMSYPNVPHEDQKDPRDRSYSSSALIDGGGGLMRRGEPSQGRFEPPPWEQQRGGGRRHWVSGRDDWHRGGGGGGPDRRRDHDRGHGGKGSHPYHHHPYPPLAPPYPYGHHGPPPPPSHGYGHHGPPPPPSHGYGHHGPPPPPSHGYGPGQYPLPLGLPLPLSQLAPYYSPPPPMLPAGPPPIGQAIRAPPPPSGPQPLRPIAFVSASMAMAVEGEGGTAEYGADESAAAPPENPEVRRDRRLGQVPDALRDALRAVEPEVAEPALAFFCLDGGHSGAQELVLEADGDTHEIVLKLDFEAKAWKRVRRKVKPS